MTEDIQIQHDEELVDYIGCTLREANRYCADRIKGTDLNSLSCSHTKILIRLLKTEPLSMQDLARYLYRDPSTITSLVKKLDAEGFVEVSKSENDGRMLQVRLTEKGLSMQPLLDDIANSILELETANVDPADLEATKRVLAQIADNFSEAISKQSNR